MNIELLCGRITENANGEVAEGGERTVTALRHAGEAYRRAEADEREVELAVVAARRDPIRSRPDSQAEF